MPVVPLTLVLESLPSLQNLRRSWRSWNFCLPGTFPDVHMEPVFSLKVRVLQKPLSLAG